MFLWSQQVFLHQAIYDRERKPESRFTFKLLLRQHCTHAYFLQISLRYSRRGCNISAPVKNETHARRRNSGGLRHFSPCPGGRATNAACKSPSRSASACDGAEAPFFRRSTGRPSLKEWGQTPACSAQSVRCCFSDRRTSLCWRTVPVSVRSPHSFFLIVDSG